MARAARRGGDGASTGSCWRRGKGIHDRWAGSAGWSLNGLGRKVEQVGGATGPIGPELKRNFFRNKNSIFEFIKALEIYTRRFRRNFNTRIFPKFFWDPQGLKNNMPCHECNLKPN
jgi:hypothetical protein